MGEMELLFFGSGTGHLGLVLRYLPHNPSVINPRIGVLSSLFYWISFLSSPLSFNLTDGTRWTIVANTCMFDHRQTSHPRHSLLLYGETYGLMD